MASADDDGLLRNPKFLLAPGEGILITKENFEHLRTASSFEELLAAAERPRPPPATNKTRNCPGTTFQGGGASEVIRIPGRAVVYDLGVARAEEELEGYRRMLQNFAAALEGDEGGANAAGIEQVGRASVRYANQNEEEKRRGRRFSNVLQLSRQRARAEEKIAKCDIGSGDGAGLLEVLDRSIRFNRRAAGLSITGRNRDLPQGMINDILSSRAYHDPWCCDDEDDEDGQATPRAPVALGEPSASAPSNDRRRRDHDKHMRNLRVSLKSNWGMTETLHALEKEHYRLVCKFLVPANEQPPCLHAASHGSLLQLLSRPTDVPAPGRAPARVPASNSTTNSSVNADIVITKQRAGMRASACLPGNCAALEIEVCNAGGEVCARRSIADLMREEQAEKHVSSLVEQIAQPTSAAHLVKFSKANFLNTDMSKLLGDLLERDLYLRLKELCLAVLRGICGFRPAPVSSRPGEEQGQSTSVGGADAEHVRTTTRALVRLYAKQTGQLGAVDPHHPADRHYVQDEESLRSVLDQLTRAATAITPFALRGLQAVVQLLRLLLVSRDSTRKSARRLVLEMRPAEEKKSEGESSVAGAKAGAVLPSLRDIVVQHAGAGSTFGSGAAHAGTGNVAERERQRAEPSRTTKRRKLEQHRTEASEAPAPAAVRHLMALQTGDFIQVADFGQDDLGSWGVVGNGEDGRAFLIPITVHKSEGGSGGGSGTSMFYWKSHVLAGRFGGGDAVRLYACVDIEKTMERKQHVDFLGKSGATVADAHTDSRVIGFVLVHLTGMRESSYHDGYPYGHANRYGRKKFQHGIFIRPGDCTSPVELVTMMTTRFSQLRQYAPEETNQSRAAQRSRACLQKYDLHGKTSIPSQMQLSLQNATELLAILADREIVAAERAEWLSSVLRAVPGDLLEVVRRLLPGCDVNWETFAKQIMASQMQAAAARNPPAPPTNRLDRKTGKKDGSGQPTNVAASAALKGRRGPAATTAVDKGLYYYEHQQGAQPGGEQGTGKGKGSGKSGKQLQRDFVFLSTAALTELQTGARIAALPVPKDTGPGHVGEGLPRAQSHGRGSTEHLEKEHAVCKRNYQQLHKENENTHVWKFIAADENAAHCEELDHLDRLTLIDFLEVAALARGRQADSSSGEDHDAGEGDAAAAAGVENNTKRSDKKATSTSSADKGGRRPDATSGEMKTAENAVSQREPVVPHLEADAFALRFTVITHSLKEEGKTAAKRRKQHRERIERRQLRRLAYPYDQAYIDAGGLPIHPEQPFSEEEDDDEDRDSMASSISSGSRYGGGRGRPELGYAGYSDDSDGYDGYDVGLEDFLMGR
mmetsp:Transcript_2235/g.5294  ORF Transcript_2235/g.5294 Transcript_2235/m.5294 type:complete len:1325 (+) Transcript_2235:237-4211(+)|eukprot:CAMPEP_0179009502 /NCGR_PEP_ID=MMETSP0795-20121207/16306_1 /TAXON_ID=88552 /ORGANISM="Amoebophrya sp., Strain Ameob2" /LENGTH=1324 /DNA_ID=CAMNT_0020704703 /DNA_START=156 /DNA_END=4130 /DNA_ORIENTATION=-